MLVLYRIASFTIVLGIIVLIHEIGHFIAARLVGVRVETFSFGFGKRILGKTIGHTDYRISLIPLGGYVKLSGEEDFENKDPKPYDFQSKNRAQKIFVFVMGPMMNLVLAFFILAGINLTGVDVDSYLLEAPVIGYIEPESPALKGGLQARDRILAINGKDVETWKEMDLLIGTNPNETINITFSRQGQINRTDIQVEADNKYEIGTIGIYPFIPISVNSVLPQSPAEEAGLKASDNILTIDGEVISWFKLQMEEKRLIQDKLDQVILLEIERAGRPLSVKVSPREEEGIAKMGVNFVAVYDSVEVRYNLLASFSESLKEMTRLTFLVFDALKKIVLGKISAKNISGPIEIAKFSQQAISSGFSSFFMLIAFISLQLGLINLLPIPVLDGGHLLIYTIEAIVRREFSPKVKMVMLNSGFFLLIALMAFVILNDIAKVLPNGWKSLIPF